MRLSIKKVFNPITYKNMTLARASMYINETRLVVNEVLQTLKMIKTVVDYHVTDWTKCFCRSSEKKMYAYYVCFVKIYLGRSEVFIYQCQSRELARDYPKLYEKVMTLKDVRAVKLCYDCLPLYHKPHKELRFKSLVFKEVVSGQPLKVPCVTKKGATDNEIRWVKDNSIYFDASFGSLGIGPVERHMGVDAVGELLISKVIKEDKGTYVCFVNGEPNVKLVLKILPQDVRETEGELVKSAFSRTQKNVLQFRIQRGSDSIDLPLPWMHPSVDSLRDIPLQTKVISFLFHFLCLLFINLN